MFLIFGILSSLLMLGKDLSESLLINGSCRSTYLAKSFPMKIMAMAQLFPAVILTAVFRLGTIALFINHVFVLDEGLLLIPLKLIFMVPPAITILCVRQKYPEIIELSVVDCFIRILCEVSGYTDSVRDKEHRRATSQPTDRLLSSPQTGFYPAHRSVANFVCCVFLGFSHV